MTTTLTEHNYQGVLAEVLHKGNYKDLMLLTEAAAGLQIVDGKLYQKFASLQWEVLFNKLKATNMNLPQETRDIGEKWCLERGIYPGGDPSESKELI